MSLSCPAWAEIRSIRDIVVSHEKTTLQSPIRTLHIQIRLFNGLVCFMECDRALGFNIFNNDARIHLTLRAHLN